jgi:hypothetical protein
MTTFVRAVKQRFFHRLVSFWAPVDSVPGLLWYPPIAQRPTRYY